MIFMSNIFISYVFYIKSSARKVTITDKMAGTATPGVPKIKFSDDKQIFPFQYLRTQAADDSEKITHARNFCITGFVIVRNYAL